MSCPAARNISCVRDPKFSSSLNFILSSQLVFQHIVLAPFQHHKLWMPERLPPSVEDILQEAPQYSYHKPKNQGLVIPRYEYHECRAFRSKHPDQWKYVVKADSYLFLPLV